ncbi:MAG: hypothetical protein EA366_14240 [Spirulina sp. DLM2.Bin59]|nr:MAG: hypothetical protein EA366_14240 [Spirulina sp. DLM2.Bin59]
MKTPQFGIITLSYAPDFERCQLLATTVQQYIAEPFTHYIIVDQRDLPLFQTLENHNTEIITVESLLPWWIFRMPMIKKTWFSLKSPPIRNWLLQQIVKIMAAKTLPKDVFVFVDSDVFFIRPFDFKVFVNDEKIRLFRVPSYSNPIFTPWFVNAHQLLGLPPFETKKSHPNFIGNIITWRQDNVIKLCDHVEKTLGMSWIKAIVQSWQFSEYVLYGTFVDQVLKEAAGHYPDWAPLCHEYWEPQPLSDPELQQFFLNLEPENVAVMISAKAEINPQRYRAVLESLALPPKV